MRQVVYPLHHTGSRQRKLETKLTQGRQQSKTPILSRNVDKKSIETVFLIAICHPTGDKWQLKTLFLSIFDLRSSIVDSVFDCHLPSVKLSTETIDNNLRCHQGYTHYFDQTGCANICFKIPFLF